MDNLDKPRRLIAAGNSRCAFSFGGCGKQDPHPLMAVGQQAIVGSYKLDDVPVGPGKLVTRAAPITGGRTKSEIS